jgi:hypothetical protein
MRYTLRSGTGLATLVAVSAAALVVGMMATGAGQGQRTPAPYSPPRTADGKPDLSGVWQALNTAAWNIQDHSAALGVPAGQGVVDGNEIPYQPWAAARKQEHAANRERLDPEAQCFLPGVPRATYMPFPFQIIQTPKWVVLSYEYAHALRTIYLDGNPHPPDGVEFWMGDSRGRWEGDTLVVDVTNLTDQTWLDRAGNFHSETLHVVERYTRTGPDHLLYEATLEDPKVFTRPWKLSMPLYRRIDKNAQLLEYDCYVYLQQAKYSR